MRRLWLWIIVWPRAFLVIIPVLLTVRADKPSLEKLKIYNRFADRTAARNLHKHPQPFERGEMALHNKLLLA